MERLKLFINGRFVESESGEYTPIYDPSTGNVIAEAPKCTEAEVLNAVSAAKKAYPGWSATPVTKRVQLMLKLRGLIERDFDELTKCVAYENGKNLSEAAGDVQKAREMTELAASASSLLMGECLWDTSSGFDTALYREPLGVFAGIAPWNFPAMIPMGWMTPLAVVCGNTYVLKAASATPMTALKFAGLYKEAGFPDGVLNVVTCSRKESEILLSHPDIKGITLVGSTTVGRHIYAKAAENGKRVQALCEAKNHALVLRDADIPKTAATIMNSAFGCAGERCMALSSVVVEEEIADALVKELIRLCKEKKVGPAYDPETSLGPVISADHKAFVESKIRLGIEEGAVLALDGRGCRVKGYENGYYIGHTILDHVKPGMTVGDNEIFGPVLCIKRVSGYEEGLAVMNANPFANGSVIFTGSGRMARDFVRRTDGGMVGVNVGIPVPPGVFPFSGHKLSFFGDLHCHGKDAFRFFTESKTVTTRWFDSSSSDSSLSSAWGGTV